MKLYITVECWNTWDQPSLHIESSLAEGLATFRKILAENNDGDSYENLSAEDACKEYNRTNSRNSSGHFLHFVITEEY